jgi:leader peptidase (prepilin peptidase) / N-methyltransferase
MEFELYSILGSVFYVIIFILGVSLGSFLNSWIWRRNENVRIMSGRSMCPCCRRKLHWYENIPILSYLYLKGRCATCKTKIPSHFIWVELVTALLFLFVTWHCVDYHSFNSTVYHRNIIFVGILTVIFIYDYLYKIILSEVVWLGLVVAIYFNYFALNQELVPMLIGAAVVSGFFLLQYIISRGKWIGGGDVRFGVLMGFMLSWPYVLVALFLSYISGAVVAVMLLISKRRKMSSEIPFGTFLAVSTFFTLFYGQNLIDWYLGLIR